MVEILVERKKLANKNKKGHQQILLMKAT